MQPRLPGRMWGKRPADCYTFIDLESTILDTALLGGKVGVSAVKISCTFCDFEEGAGV
jgi:hypothetical protein